MWPKLVQVKTNPLPPDHRLLPCPSFLSLLWQPATPGNLFHLLALFTFAFKDFRPTPASPIPKSFLHQSVWYRMDSDMRVILAVRFGELIWAVGRLGSSLINGMQLKQPSRDVYQLHIVNQIWIICTRAASRLFSTRSLYWIKQIIN